MEDKIIIKIKNAKNRDVNHEIVCPTCGNKISTPQNLRCPRCFAPLIRTGCDGKCSRCNEKC